MIDIERSASADPYADMSDEVEPFVDELANALGLLQRIRERKIHQYGWRGPDGLDLAAFRCLFTIINDGPMRSGALAEAVLSDPSTISRHVSQLVQLGYFERQADPDDGRASVIAVTELGRTVAAEMRLRRNLAFGKVIEQWPIGDRREFLRLLTRLAEDEECSRPAGAPGTGKTTSRQHGAVDTDSAQKGSR